MPTLADYASVVPWSGIQNVPDYFPTTPALIAQGGATNGQALVWNSVSKAWVPTAVSGGGPAGGDLSGNYPDPEVAAIHETSGPTQLVIGEIDDGDYLMRSGGTIVGGTPAGGGDVTGPSGAVSGDIVLFDGTSGLLIKDSGLTPSDFDDAGAAATAQANAEAYAVVQANAAQAAAEAASTAVNATMSGDLAGTLPSPTVAAIHETSGPTKLTIGSIPDGDFVKRSGTTLIGASGSGSGTVTSVALTMPTGFSVGGSPITTSGTLAVTTSLSGILKGAAGAFTTATSGTDYAPATSGSSILSGNGSGAFSNVTVGTGLTFTGGTLTNSGSLSNPMTTLGDMIYGGSSGTPTRFAGQTSARRQYASQTGTGSASAAPTWVNGSTYNVMDFGATGNGSTDDTAAITAAITAAAANAVSSVFFPDGKYIISSPLEVPSGFGGKIGFFGSSMMGTQIIVNAAVGNGFQIDLSGGTPAQNSCEIRDLSITTASGITGGTAISITMGTSNPRGAQTNVGNTLQNIWVGAGAGSGFINGMLFTNCGNDVLTNIYMYGSATGYDSAGSGVAGTGTAFGFLNTTINMLFSNIQVSFWYASFEVLASGSDTAQGFHFTDILIVQSPNAFYVSVGSNGSTFILTNYQVDNGNLPGQTLAGCLNVTGIAGLYLTNFEFRANAVTILPASLTSCSNVVISNGLILSGTSTTTGISMTSVNSSEIYGLFLEGFTNGVLLGSGCTFCHVRDCIGSYTRITDSTSFATTNNLIYSQLAGCKAVLQLTSPQSISNGAGGEASISWSSATSDTTGGALWSSGSPTTIVVPTGAQEMRITVQAKFDINATGNRFVKIKDSSGNVWGGLCAPGDGTDPTYMNATTPALPVAGLGITSFIVTVIQFSGGSLNLDAGSAGATCVGIEVTR